MNISYELNQELLQDYINIANGLFYPLEGFMNSSDYHSVVDNMTLANGEVWTIPICLDIDYDTYMKVVDSEKLNLTYNHKLIGYILIDDCYMIKNDEVIIKIFGTKDINHPGVKKELLKHKYRIGGKIIVKDETILADNLKPKEIKSYFKNKGWNTIAGFQTRNPIHKAHEHLQRVALEVCDALFINPLVGWKKKVILVKKLFLQVIKQ